MKKGEKECDRLRYLCHNCFEKDKDGDCYFLKRSGMRVTEAIVKERDLFFKFNEWDSVRQGCIYFEQDSKEYLNAFIKKANDEGISITGFEYHWRDGGQSVILKNLEDRVEYKVKISRSNRCDPWGLGICYSVHF